MIVTHLAHLAILSGVIMNRYIYYGNINRQIKGEHLNVFS